MDIQLDTLLKGKQTRIKDKEYFETEAYVNPFLERMSKITSDFRVKVELPEQITLTKDGDVNFEDITYNRVWIQAILPEQFDVDNHQDVIGMVYGIDTRKPIVKFYRGGLNRACTNLCVFNPDYLDVQELQPEVAIDYRPLDMLINKANEIKVFLEKLHNITFPRDNQYINEQLGMWIRNCLNIPYYNGINNVKLATSTSIDAYKLLFEKDSSDYYVPVTSNTDMFNVYNAFTELISNDKDKDIMNKCEKTLLLKSILGV